MAEAKAAGWAAEREDLQAERERLQKALKAKDELLREEVSKNAGFAADLEQALAGVVYLREEAEEAARPRTLTFPPTSVAPGPSWCGWRWICYPVEGYAHG